MRITQTYDNPLNAKYLDKKIILFNYQHYDTILRYSIKDDISFDEVKLYAITQ